MNASLYTRIGITALVAVAAGAILFSKNMASDNDDQSAPPTTDAVNHDVPGAADKVDANKLAQRSVKGDERDRVGTASDGDSKPIPRLLDLGADKCVPCKLMAPILEELREDFRGQFEVVFIDVWKNPEAAKLHRVQLIPTQIFFDESGRELARHQGFFSRDDILQKWRELGFEFTGEDSQAPNAAGEDSVDTRSMEGVINDHEIASTEAAAPEPDWWIEVMYLHPTMRCHDCLLAERTVAHAVRETFADELAMGYLRWRAVDYEAPANRSLAEKFNVTEGSELIIACVSNEGIMRWELVPDVLDFGLDEFAATECVRDAFLTFEQVCHAKHAAEPDEHSSDHAAGDI